MTAEDVAGSVDESVDVKREMVGEAAGSQAEADAKIQKSRARMQELRNRVTRRLKDARPTPD